LLCGMVLVSSVSLTKLSLFKERENFWRNLHRLVYMVSFGAEDALLAAMDTLRMAEAGETDHEEYRSEKVKKIHTHRPTSCNKTVSSTTLTPNSLALSSFDPASLPATT
jgi:hypothetical protein